MELERNAPRSSANNACITMAKVDPGSTGMLVSRLVEEMAQTSFDDHEDIASVKKLAKGIGLKEISAFVPDRRAPRSNAATNKAKQRDKNSTHPASTPGRRAGLPQRSGGSRFGLSGGLPIPRE